MTTITVDLAAFLYLNPEVSGSATTHAQAAALWESDATAQALPATLPTLPVGFDPRVYLVSQPDVSLLNLAIKGAMIAQGLDEAAVERRGVFVNTIMKEVLLVDSETMSFRLEYASPAAGIEFGPGVLQVGDVVKLQRQMGRGAAHTMEARIEAVDADLYGFKLDPVIRRRGPALTLDASGQGGKEPLEFVLLGIKVWDPQRQARIAYVREQELLGAGEPSSYPYSAGVTSNTDVYDIVPHASFDVQMYRALYPETRAHTFSDTYIDYRTRWKRGDDYRIKNATEILNLQSPLTPDILGSGGGGSGSVSTGNDLYVSNGGVLYAGALTATPTYVSVNGDTILGSTGVSLPESKRGFLVVASNALWAGSNAVHGPLMTLDSSGNLSLRSSSNGIGISPTLDISASDRTVDILGGALKVDGGSNVVSVLQGVGATIDRSNVDLLEGSAVFTRESVALLEDVMTMESNSVRMLGNTLSIDRNVMFFDGRIGIGMPCSGQEGVATYEAGSGWQEPATDILDTKLAVDGNIYTTGTLISLSDPREKRDIRPIEDALDRLRGMSGYTYCVDRYSDERRHVGLLASEVARAMPEAVYTVPAPPSSKLTTESVSSVAYGNLVGLLASAVNQLHDRVMQLEKGGRAPLDPL